MSDQDLNSEDDGKSTESGRLFEDLPPAAQRALTEAADRRKALETKRLNNPMPKEVNGRGGLDPVRYDDWEVKGVAVDF